MDSPLLTCVLILPQSGASLSKVHALKLIPSISQCRLLQFPGRRADRRSVSCTVNCAPLKVANLRPSNMAHVGRSAPTLIDKTWFGRTIDQRCIGDRIPAGQDTGMWTPLLLARAVSLSFCLSRCVSYFRFPSFANFVTTHERCVIPFSVSSVYVHACL